MQLRGKTMDMTTGKISRQLMLFALPLMAENLFQLLYNTVDSIIVGRFVGKDALAAVGATTYVLFFFTGGLIGLAAGITAVAARHFGARREEALRNTVRTSFSLAVIFGIGLLLLGQWSVAPTLVLTKIPAEIEGLVAGYLRVCYVGLPAVAIFNVGSGILRAVGNSRLPVYILILTSLVNILLDLVFVVGLRGGVSGAAWATVLAQYVSAGMVLAFLAREKGSWRFTFRDLRLHRDALREILTMGLPQMAERSVTGLSNVVVQSYINVFGAACIAGYSILVRTETFLWTLVVSFSTAALTFAGQNAGARKFGRMKRGTRAASLIALALIVAVGGAMLLLRVPLASLFNTDPEVVAYSAAFMLVVIPFYPVICFYQPYSSMLKAVGAVLPTTIIMLFSFVASRQVYLYFGTRWWANTPLFVMYAFPLGYCVCGVLMAAYYLLGGWKKWLGLAPGEPLEDQ